MSLDLLLGHLRAHLAAQRSSAWPRLGEGPGPVMYLDIAETEALIAELTRTRERAGASRAASAPALNFLGS